MVDREGKVTNRHSGRRVAKIGISGKIPEHDHLVVLAHRPIARQPAPRFLRYGFSLGTFNLGTGLRLIRMSLHARRAGANVFLGSDGQVSENPVG